MVNKKEPRNDGGSDGDDNDEEEEQIDPKIVQGRIDILFAHPEYLLGDAGRKLMKSTVFKQNVVGMVVDEAHCIESW